MQVYCQKVLGFVFRDFAVRTDLTFGLVSLVATLLVGPDAKPVDQLTTYDLGEYAAYTIGIYLLLRLLVFGPYQVWKGQVEETDKYQKIANNPQRMIDEGRSKHKAKARDKLVRSVMKFGLHACKRKKRARKDSLGKETFKAISLAHSAGYGKHLREILIKYSNLCDMKQKQENVVKRLRGEELILAHLNDEISLQDVLREFPRPDKFQFTNEKGEKINVKVVPDQV